MSFLETFIVSFLLLVTGGATLKFTARYATPSSSGRAISMMMSEAEIKSPKVLVLGGTGFVGREIGR
jgi:hypothetical protein